MYKVSSGGKIIAICDKPRFIKLNNESGAYIEAGQAEAIGVVVGGKVYNYGGNQIAEGAEDVTITEVDGGEILLNIQEDLSAAQNVGGIVFVTLAESESLDDVTIIEHSDLFLPWVFPAEYKAGDIRRYGEKLFKCLQAHTSQEDWSPDKAVSLWKEIGNPEDEYPVWSQPIGAGDAYMIGDKVTYKGEHYISLIDNNVWSPEAYPQGWDHV